MRPLRLTHPGPRAALAAVLCGLLLGAAGDDSIYPPSPPGMPPPLAVPDAAADSPEAMRPYLERIPGTAASFRMQPLAGGRFWMGSPEDEPGREACEGPRHEVELSPFWIGVREVSWEEYGPFMQRLEAELRRREPETRVAQDAWADAVTRPTPPYVPMDFGMGVEDRPAISMTQFAARQYTKWLSMKTGRFYRLPTEAEWEYACRAGNDAAYSFGADAARLGEHAWYYENADDRYHPLGAKQPNAFGLYDLHGNVAEWVLDGFSPEGYPVEPGALRADPLVWPTTEYPRVVRGGSWDDDAPRLRSAARGRSKPGWKVQDPQLPKSIWYLTDAPFVGFRVVRPLRDPSPEEAARWWEADLDEVRRIEARQRTGAR